MIVRTEKGVGRGGRHDARLRGAERSCATAI